MILAAGIAVAVAAIVFVGSLAAAFHATRRMTVPQRTPPVVIDSPVARPLVRRIGIGAVEWALFGHQMPGRRGW